MAVMDEFKEQRAALKNGTFKQKLSYFWYYYKWHTIGSIAALVAVILLIHDIVSQKNEVFYAAMLNSSNLLQDESFAEQFMEYAGIDPNADTATFDDSLSISFSNLNEITLASAQKLQATMIAGKVDVIVAGDELFENYANDGVVTDLRQIMTSEQLAVYKPYLYYVDRVLVEQIAEANYNLDTSFQPEIPNPTKPELMEDPVPVGIYVDSSTLLTSNYRISDGDRIVAGFLANSNHTDMAIKFIEFLLGAE